MAGIQQHPKFLNVIFSALQGKLQSPIRSLVANPRAFKKQMGIDGSSVSLDGKVSPPAFTSFIIA